MHKMTSSKVAVIIFLTLLSSFLLTACHSNPSQPAPSAPQEAKSNASGLPLQLTVKTDRQTLRMSDSLNLQIQLLNSGKEDLYIWKGDLCWNVARGLSLFLIDHKGDAAHGSFVLDCSPTPPANGELSEFILLHPGEAHTEQRSFGVRQLVNDPGTYSLRVTYSSFLSESFIKHTYSDDPIASRAVWTSDRPLVVAQPTQLNITR